MRHGRATLRDYLVRDVEDVGRRVGDAGGAGSDGAPGEVELVHPVGALVSPVEAGALEQEIRVRRHRIAHPKRTVLDDGPRCARDIDRRCVVGATRYRLFSSRRVRCRETCCGPG